MPKPLRGIFRKRRKLLHHLFQVSIESLRDWMRTRLDLPDGQIAAIAAVQTFGDYLGFHPHIHILAATGLIDKENHFHLLPVEKRRGPEAFWTEAELEPAGRTRRAGRANQNIEALTELFRHRFIQTLLDEKLISQRKARQLLAWKNSGFSLDAGEKPIAANDVEGRRRLAEYLLRAPFSLEKMTWNESTQKVIYRSKRSWHTKQNFKIFSAVDFIAAVVEHIPPKGQQTVRYYGRYSNKSRGLDAKNGRPRPELEAPPQPGKKKIPQPTLFVLPPPEAKSRRALRPLWRDLILKIWGDDPLICPCCKGEMKILGAMIRREEVEFFLRLHGLWEGIIGLPPPPDPPFDIETLEPLNVPPQNSWSWSDSIDLPPIDWWDGGEEIWKASELDLGDGTVLVLDAEYPQHTD